MANLLHSANFLFGPISDYMVRTIIKDSEILLGICAIVSWVLGGVLLAHNFLVAIAFCSHIQLPYL